MGLSDEISKLMPANFGKKKKTKPAAFVKNIETQISNDNHKDGNDNNHNQDSKQTKSSQPKDSESDKRNPDNESEKLDTQIENKESMIELLPITKNVTLRSHIKTISSLTWDPSGARLLSADYGGDIKFWDFGGMDSDFRPFRSIEPFEGNKLHDIKFSPSGDRFLVVGSGAQPKLFDRDGFVLQTYKLGDQYIRDMRHTSGHVASLAGCGWHPNQKNTFVTASADSTIRIWDTEQPFKQKQVMVLKTKQRGNRTAATAITYSPDGRYIFSGKYFSAKTFIYNHEQQDETQEDGALSMWASDGPYLKPVEHVEMAHMPGTETSSIACSTDGYNIVTRGGDDIVKLWDIRYFKQFRPNKPAQPVHEARSLDVYHPQTNIIYSPDEKYILTGVGVKRGQGMGYIKVFDSKSLELVKDVPVTEASVIQVLWHPKLNQLAAGSSDGNVTVWYDPEKSIKGATLCVTKKSKAQQQQVLAGGDTASADGMVDFNGKIITPHALPLFRDSAPKSTKRQREKLRKDPIASHRPQLPISGHGKGGYIGSNETQHIMKNLIKDTTRDEDPREAILKYAKAAEEDPYWVAPAYKERQPVTLFDETGMKEEREIKRRK
ncbi:hypothetical protein H4219_004233 [Mycoemilia scoparia]|uniref:WD40 repeat-like protein n=1 Tax=Mycoemilia scoparia TaxID=417184 RepID=A0A9W8DN55_9FUNG|nr:hypothetical protein H4219_004233 [Mycoemilia scoparia]